MKTAFIACEYNPFHNGHLHHIKETKAHGADVVICIMSGNFVQRGDIAVANKFIRAKTALVNGADIVIELPLKYATSDASHFAEGFIKTIKATGLGGFISFGAKNGIAELYNTQKIIFSDEAEFFAEEKQKSGISYAAAKSLYLKEKSLTESVNILDDANNILALEYINKAVTILDNPEFYCITRKGTSHDSMITEDDIASASYIRKQLYNDKTNMQNKLFFDSFRNFIPESVSEIYEAAYSDGLFPVNNNLFRHAEFSRLMSIDSEQLKHTNNVNGGLENRILEKLRSSNSIEELFDEIKTKRYTHSRIRQIILQTILGITREDIRSGVSYIRILGFNETGRNALKAMKSTAELPIVTNLSDINKYGEAAARDAHLDYIAGKLHNICTPCPIKGNSEYNSHPVIFK